MFYLAHALTRSDSQSTLSLTFNHIRDLQPRKKTQVITVEEQWLFVFNQMKHFLSFNNSGLVKTGNA